LNKNFSGKFWPFTFYLLFFAGAAAIFNFLALFFQSKGLPGSQIGILMGTSSLVGLVAGPLWSALADATQRHRLILSVAILGSLIAVFFYPFVNVFLGFLVLVTLQALFGGPIISMVDNASMTMLGDEREMYGRVRLGGTIGWGLMAAVMGVVVERTGLRWNFMIYSGMFLLALLISQKLRFSNIVSGRSFFGGMRELLTDRKWIVFLLIVFIAGSGNAAISAYLFVYLQDIGASPTLMGLAITIATIAEFPALFFANRLMKSLGPRGLLTLGLIATAVRCILYGVIGVPWMALVVQLLQAVTFPVLLVAGVSYADLNAPPGMGATAQSIFSSAFMGVGYAAGGFFGGVMIEYLGTRQMFLVFGGLILLAAMIFGVAQRMREPVTQPA
jgi:MFS transporter, PPP family, 3-phenylpropionic acid transporter